MRSSLLALVLAIGLFAAACGGGGEKAADTTLTSEPSTTAETTPATEPTPAPKPAPAKPSPAPTKGRTYAGETAQSLPISVSISQDGRSVAKLSIAWRAKCADGTTRSTTSTFRKLVIGKKKHFEGLSVGEVTGVLSGTFTSGWKVVRGTWNAQVLTGELLPGEAFAFNDCNAGRVRWEARLR